MARDRTSGEKPPKPQAAECEPQIAESANAEPPRGDQSTIAPEILEKFAPPGVTWKEAVTYLKPEIDITEAQINFGKAITEHHDKTLRYQYSQIPFTASVPTFERFEHKAAEKLLFSLLKKNVLVASGHVNNAEIRRQIEPDEWLDNWVLQYNDKAYRPSTKTTVANIRILRPADLTDNDKVGFSVEKNPRGAGAKPREDWPKLMGEWVKLVAMHDLPKNKAEAHEWICAAADKLNAPHPAEATFRDHIKRTLGEDFWNGLSKQ